MRSHKVLILIMLLVASFTGISSGIYAPSLSAIAYELKAPIDEVQLSMAIFMLGVSISQLVYGPASEVVGRRMPLLIGLVIMLIGSIVCFYATNITMLIASRFVQGLGAGSTACLWRSIFRDSFDSTQMGKYGAYLGIILTLIVPTAPTIGGYLQEFFGWRANFLFLIIYSLTTIFVILFLFKETSIHHHKDRFNRKFFISAFSELLSSRIFIGYTLCTFLSYGAFFSWFIIGPVLLINNMGVSPVTFGWMNLCLGALSMPLAAFVNSKMLGHFRSHTMLRLGWSIMSFAGILMILLKLLYGTTIISILAPAFIFLFGATFIWPNIFAGAFAPFGKIAGCAGALYSFMQMGGAAVIGSLGAFLPTTSQIPLAIIFIASSTVALVIFEWVVIRDVQP